MNAPGTLHHVREPEGELLRVARALFEPKTHASILPILRQACPLAPKLGESAMRVLKDVLGKGLVRLLARASATPRLRTTVAQTGSELARPPKLEVSASSFELLRWMVARPLVSTAQEHRLELTSPLTFADQLLFALAFDALDAARLGGILRTQLGERVLACPYLWLLTPDLGPVTHVPSAESFAGLAEEEGADALWLSSGLITPRQLRVERAKAIDADVERLERISLAHAAVLERATAAIVASRRLHALTFLFEVEAALIPNAEVPFEARALVRTNFPSGLSLSQRERIRRAGSASHRALGAVAVLRERLRSIGFVDDEYDEAQRLQRFLEPWDEGRFARAADVVRISEGLDVSDVPAMPDVTESEEAT